MRQVCFGLLFASICFAPRLAVGDDLEIPGLPSHAAIAAAPSFGPDEHVVATHYFYWYRWPNEHFFDGANHKHSILRHHFPDDHAVDYESADWHRRQVEDLLAAGIDVALPVYWGAPNDYEAGGVRFSIHGLPPLVQALDESAQRGRVLRIGMFYDTSTLLAGHAFVEKGRGNVDLRTAAGRDIFYRTIRDFFCLVPPRHWACLDGRPIVQLYNSAFAAGHDQSVIDYVYERFGADFAGRRPFIISGPSWHVQADARVGWGAALGGPILGDGVAQIGPGYDDSPVPGRGTPTRDRLDGGFYQASWLLALQARPRLVIIETWSELHEGTGICETLEDGRMYIDLTRQYSDIFKAGRQPGQSDWAAAVRALLHASSSSSAGREFAGRIALKMHAEDGQLVEQGLSMCRGLADGMFEVVQITRVDCVRSKRGITEHRYLYFDIADPYYYDHRGALRVCFTYFDEGQGEIIVQYDSTDESGDIADRYKEHPQRIRRTDSKTWKTATLTLSGARCANRQNGGADFRLASLGQDIAVTSVEISKLPEGYAE
ncbi:MAG: DUF5010 domain-containing protein [Planctomycetes bacterium]|nr:DUF5010 domain-containing protein [Planctomycetota bacterium]